MPTRCHAPIPTLGHQLSAIYYPRVEQACSSEAISLNELIFSTLELGFQSLPCDLSFTAITGAPAVSSQICQPSSADCRFCTFPLLKTSCIFLSSVDEGTDLTSDVNTHLTVKPQAADLTSLCLSVLHCKMGTIYVCLPIIYASIIYQSIICVSLFIHLSVYHLPDLTQDYYAVGTLAGLPNV